MCVQVVNSNLTTCTHHIKNFEIKNKMRESDLNTNSMRGRKFHPIPTIREKSRKTTKRRNRRYFAKISENHETWRDAPKHENKVFQIINTSILSAEH